MFDFEPTEYFVRELVLGQGATSQVKLIEYFDHKGRHRMGAGKIIYHPGPFASNCELEQFKENARTLEDEAAAYQKAWSPILSFVINPNIPKLIDFYLASSKNDLGIAAYLILEYIPGETIESLCAADYEERSELKVITRASQMAVTLSYLHESAKLVNGDIKPANFIVKPANAHKYEKEKVYLIDLGTAHKKGKAPGKVNMATPGYAAPERYPTSQSPGTCDELSDIYSLGVTMRFMLSGIEPRIDSWNQTTKEVAPRVSCELAEVIDKCCSLKRDDRYCSMTDVFSALNACSLTMKDYTKTGLGLAEDLCTPLDFEEVSRGLDGVLNLFTRINNKAQTFIRGMY